LKFLLTKTCERSSGEMASWIESEKICRKARFDVMLMSAAARKPFGK
jgi:hypothetical protein